MTGLTVGLVAVGVLLALLGMGVPVAFSMLLVGFCGFLFILGMEATISLVGSTLYHSVANWLYIVIPMFILMGEFAGESGIIADLFSFFKAWIGRLRGSLAVATIFTAAMFSFATGSSLATTAVMGKLTLPEMRKSKYGENISLGSVLAGGTLGNMIPPSIGLVLYGILTDVSIGKLLLAGLIPGLLTASAFILWIITTAIRHPEVAPQSAPSSWREKLSSLWKVWGMLLVVVCVLGSIYTGIATVTEAATVGCFATFVIALVLRKMNLARLQRSLQSTALLSAMIFLLLATVAVFSRFLIFAGVTTTLMELATTSALSRWVILIAVYLIIGALGCIVDPTSLMLLSVPLVFPIIVGLGFDPVWFGVISVVMIQIGMITPPVGMCLYVLRGVSGAPLQRCIASSLPVLAVWLVILVLLTACPSIATWLPSTM